MTFVFNIEKILFKFFLHIIFLSTKYIQYEIYSRNLNKSALFIIDGIYIYFTFCVMKYLKYNKKYLIKLIVKSILVKLLIYLNLFLFIHILYT